MGYYAYVYGPDVSRDFACPFYEEELLSALYRLNPALPEDAISDALSKLKTFENAELVQKNAVFMDYLQNGVPVRYVVDGEERAALVYLANYRDPDNNSFVIANQWTFIEHSTKRPDILLFLNGLPVVIMELKSPSREEADASQAYLQLRNYMREIPTLFVYNAICVMSDQLSNRAGTITSGKDRFMEWKTVDGSYENTQYAQFDTFFEGIFRCERFLDILKNFIRFSNDGVQRYKILAGYHQYFAVRKFVFKPELKSRRVCRAVIVYRRGCPVADLRGSQIRPLKFHPENSRPVRLKNIISLLSGMRREDREAVFNNKPPASKSCPARAVAYYGSFPSVA